MKLLCWPAFFLPGSLKDQVVTSCLRVRPRPREIHVQFFEVSHPKFNGMVAKNPEPQIL